jgi:tetratricopeptide (TPR) repeat protein
VDKSIALDPRNDLAWHVLGVWQYEIANLNSILRAIAGLVYGSIPSASNEDAVKAFKKALELNPRRVANHVELGRTYLVMGKKAEAKAELEKGLSLPDQQRDDPDVKQRAREAHEEDLDADAGVLPARPQSLRLQNWLLGTALVRRRIRPVLRGGLLALPVAGPAPLHRYAGGESWRLHNIRRDFWRYDRWATGVDSILWIPSDSRITMVASPSLGRGNVEPWWYPRPGIIYVVVFLAA